ncbi:hypothetical protein G3480_01750 [Thiorhodococcus mannitoliphagus]|uniref:Thyroglobulin type-1 domain-containing protein n=1 Tax=Thiorhodococcus mannitoliphagus TaxID=329406 RepID=A0A6P1DND1_9GAMM|nr:hypothetical protein [Thiorhodococcus mannitoliphagus]
MAGVLIPLLALGGCAKSLSPDGPVPQQFVELSCLADCRTDKNNCDEEARYDYRQCEAGYANAFRGYRWCLASALGEDECGYPWWPCAGNLYGYCSNRYQECQRACDPLSVY